MIDRILLFVALAIGIALWAVARHQRRGGRISPLWGVGFLWVALSTLYLGASFAEQPAQSTDFSCPLPGQDSQYGSSTWQSWPPGPVCRDADGRVFSRPGFRGGATIVIAAAGSAAFLIAAGMQVRAAARRRTRVEDRAA
jgi:hypothetical protein